MRHKQSAFGWGLAGVLALGATVIGLAHSQEAAKRQANPAAERGEQGLQRSSYLPVIEPDFQKTLDKMINILERASQVHDVGEFQELLGFPPAPKLDPFGKLISRLASESEMRGQAVFFGKGRCAECHVPPYYTDNLMHNLKTEQFYKPQEINGILAVGDGPIKTFVLRGIKESPPYLHDGWLLTLDDTVEFFNLVLGLKLTDQEKKDLVAYMLAL